MIYSRRGAWAYLAPLADTISQTNMHRKALPVLLINFRLSVIHISCIHTFSLRLSFSHKLDTVVSVN